MQTCQDRVSIEAQYNKFLKNVTIPLVGNGETISTELASAGKKLFGAKFAGVFPADMIPSLDNNAVYTILNLDKHDAPGSHWIAVAKEESGDVWVYDSFGRPTQTILPDIGQHFNFFDTDYDAEQLARETNCGARSLAWLMVFDKFGPQLAKLV